MTQAPYTATVNALIVDVDGHPTVNALIVDTAGNPVLSPPIASDPIWDAKGDLVAGTGADAATRVAVGSNGQVLIADSSQTGGVRWGPAGSFPLTWMKSGWYSFLQEGGTPLSAAKGVGEMQLMPFVLAAPVTLSRIGAEVTVAADAGSTGVIAIYSDDGTGMLPGALLYDASASGSASTILANGLISLASATVQDVTVSWALAAGVVYWAGMALQNAAHNGTAFTGNPTLRLPSAQAYSLPTATTIPTAALSGNNFGARQLSVVGALPATFVAGTAPTIAGVRLHAKAA